MTTLSTSEFKVGRWSFRAIPRGWELLEGRGLRRAGKDVFPSNVIATEDELGPDMTLQQYLEAQLPIIRHYFLDPQFEFRGPANIEGVDEALMLTIGFTSDDNQRAIQRQVYVRLVRGVGILTFTTLESELKSVDSSFVAILSGISFR